MIRTPYPPLHAALATMLLGAGVTALVACTAPVPWPRLGGALLLWSLWSMRAGGRWMAELYQLRNQQAQPAARPEADA